MENILFLCLIIYTISAHAYEFDFDHIDDLKILLNDRNDELKPILLNTIAGADRKENLKWLKEKKWLTPFSASPLLLIPNVMRELEKEFSSELLTQQKNQHGRWNQAFFKAFVDELRGIGQIYVPIYGTEQASEELARTQIAPALKHNYLEILVASGLLKTPLEKLVQPYNISEEITNFFAHKSGVHELMLASSHARKFGDSNASKLVMNLDPSRGADIISDVHEPAFWQNLPDSHFTLIEDDSNTPGLLASNEKTITQIHRVLAPGGILDTPALRVISAVPLFIKAGFECRYLDSMSLEEADSYLKDFVRGQAWGSFSKGLSENYQDFIKSYSEPSIDELRSYAQKVLFWVLDEDKFLIPTAFVKPPVLASID